MESSDGEGSGLQEELLAQRSSSPLRLRLKRAAVGLSITAALLLALLAAVHLSRPAPVETVPVEGLEQKDGGVRKTEPDRLMRDLYRFWDAFRDSSTGAHCDKIHFRTQDVCDGTRSFFSSAGTGMGLVAQCIFAELGLRGRQQAKAVVRKTLAAHKAKWPRDAHHGFYAHFAKSRGEGFENLAEYSTIDSAIFFAGALFAGNYFGGDIKATAKAMAKMVKWSDAIQGASSPAIHSVANVTMRGSIKPFNEYYIVAYLAKLMDPDPTSKASRYFEKFFSSTGRPVGTKWNPVHKNYWGFDLLTDGPNIFMSSFIPQFCWFLTKGFQTNSYYSKTLFKAWLQADMKYWDLITNSNSNIGGKKVKGKVFGCGAGAGHDKSYTVNRINGKEEHIFSAAIMAGFLAVDDASLRADINSRLAWLMGNNVCTYEKKLPDGYKAIVPWRCSIENPTWKATWADSVDFATLVLGYALNFLPQGFYAKYAA